MEKGVLYLRYSPGSKQTQQSIEGQERDCMTYAKTKGIKIIGKYIDEALTGKDDNRPDFQRMMKDSHKKLFKYIIVWQLDRFARSKYDSAHYKHLLKKNEVKVLSAKENINDDPSGILMETMLEGMAEYYSVELAQKVKRGLYEGFLKGHTSGSRCYGYDLVPVDPTANAKKFVINKAESEIIRSIFDQYASGIKIKDTIKDFQISGIKSRKGSPFCYNSIMTILKNTKYIGTLSFGTESRENAIPAIIDKGVFELAQKRINANKRNPNWFKAKEHFLLSTKTVCGFCKASIIAESGTSASSGITYRYYKCYNKKKAKAPCEKEQYNKLKFEMEVVVATYRLLSKQGMIERIARQVVDYNDELQINPKLELYEKQLKTVEKTLDNIMRAVEQGIFNDKTQGRMLELESEKADLLYRIDKEKMHAPIRLDYLETVYWFEQFANGDMNDEQFRERLIDAFVHKVILWNKGRMIIVYNIKGKDGEKISIDQIISDFDKEKAELIEFDSVCNGGAYHFILEPSTIVVCRGMIGLFIESY